MQLAEADLAAGLFEEAVAYYGEGLAQAPTDIKLKAKLGARCSIASRLCQPGQVGAAMLDSTMAIHLDPDSRQVYLASRALAYRAVAAHSKAVEVWPYYRTTHH